MAFQIVRNDITKIQADAIVNTANPEPVYMAGTDSAVYMAAGAERLLEERQKIGVIKEGEVAVTPAFDLPAKYIFHTVGPVWQDGNSGEKEIEKKCYENCLKKAVEMNLESIAFTLISTGVNGFPKTDALQIATSVFSSFLADHEMDITLAVFDTESFRLSGRIFAGVSQYIDEHYVEEKIVEEYSYEDAEAVEDSREEKSTRRPRRNERFFGRMRECGAQSAPMADFACASAAPVQRSLDDVVKNLSETWTESLFRLIREKGYDEVEDYKRANVDRKLFSKIRKDKNYQPKKTTAMAFAIALRLNLDETKDFLGRAGYCFSPSSLFDTIICYCIENEEYNFMDINEVLFDYDQPLLG